MCFIFYSGPKSGQDSLEGGSWWGTFKVPLPTPQDVKLIYASPFGKKGCCLATFLTLRVFCLFPYFSPTVFGKFLWKTVAASAVLRETNRSWSVNTSGPELFKGRVRGSSECKAHKGKMLPRSQDRAILSSPGDDGFCFIKGDGVPFQGYSESDSQRLNRARTMSLMTLYTQYLIKCLTQNGHH